MDDIRNNEKRKTEELSSLVNQLADTREKLKTMKHVNLSQQEELKKVDLEIKSLRSSNLELRDFISKHNLEVSNCKKGIINLHYETLATIRDHILLSHKSLFSSTKNLFTNGHDDIANALAFRASSPKGYNYVRKHLKLSDHSHSTLHRWTKGCIF